MKLRRAQSLGLGDTDYLYMPTSNACDGIQTLVTERKQWVQLDGSSIACTASDQTANSHPHRIAIPLKAGAR